MSKIIIEFDASEAESVMYALRILGGHREITQRVEPVKPEVIKPDPVTQSIDHAPVPPPGSRCNEPIEGREESQRGSV